MYPISNTYSKEPMDIKAFPTLKTHILTTPQATELIDWHYSEVTARVKVLQYPLPTEVVLLPGKDIDINKGFIWPSKSKEFEFVGTPTYAQRNNYRVAQVYTDVGEDGHTLYALYGWLHITTHDLKYGPKYDLQSKGIPLHVSLFNLYQVIEEGAPTD